jgi:hypothetical protein
MEEIFSPSSARSIQLQKEVDEKSRFPSLTFSSVALGHAPREYWVWTEAPTLLDFFKEAELREYEDRCDRIRQLYAQLIDNQEAAA